MSNSHFWVVGTKQFDKKLSQMQMSLGHLHLA